MLKFGQRLFELVRAPSGFFVELDFAPGALRTQEWRLEAHFVPCTDTPPRPDGELEYLQLTVNSEDYRVSDWRELTGLGLDPVEEGEDSLWVGSASLQNLLVGFVDPESFRVVPGDLIVERRERYLFHCEFDGLVRHEDGRDEDIEFTEELPFAGVTMRVPVNAPNPVAYAQARASRVLGPLEFADARVQRHDWRLEDRPDARIEDTHLVILRTAWRQTLA